jgi:hypothetical protein
MKTENLHVFEEELLDVMTEENLHVFEEEFLDVEEEILDVMEAENLHVIEEERSVPVSAPRKPKRVKLMAPMKLIRSDKMADRSGNRKVTRHMTRKHVRFDGMVLNFDEIVTEDGPDREKSNGKRKTQFYKERSVILSARLQSRCTVRRTVARSLITGLMQGRWCGSVMTQSSTIGSCAAKSIGVLRSVRRSW